MVKSGVVCGLWTTFDRANQRNNYFTLQKQLLEIPASMLLYFSKDI